MGLVDLLTKVFAALAALGLTSAIAASVAYWLFQTFAKGWLDAHFAKDLEAFKADNAREVERLKAELTRYADRATKFHAREYEVLPEAWGLMNKAHGAAHTAVMAFQRYADLNVMSAPRLEAWLENSWLDGFQKDEIRQASDKTSKFGDFLTWRQIGDAEKAVSDFINYVILQGVFIDEEISSVMLEAGKSMHGAIIVRSMVEGQRGSLYHPGQPDFWQKAMDDFAPVAEMVLVMKDVIRQRLSDIKAPVSAGS